MGTARKVALIVGALAIAILIADELFVIRECMWVGTARAWADENKNGLWESNEPPLAGVSFILKRRDVQVASVSNQTGEARLALRTRCGISFEMLEIQAHVPDGRMPTSDMSINAFDSNNGPFDFGFAPVESDSP